MSKNQKPSQTNDPWYIPAVPTGKFGASNCPVRALRYYHRYMSEHPELWKGRRRLFIPIKDSNAGKELSAATISRWICTTIVDSHASIQKSKNLQTVKSHEVRTVATLLQLFNKVDLQTRLVIYFAVSLVGPLVPTSSFKKGGGSWWSPTGSRFRSFGSLWEPYHVCRLGAKTSRPPTLICQILDPSEMSYELFVIISNRIEVSG